MSLVIAAATGTKAYVACDSRIVSQLKFLRWMRRDGLPKFVELVPGRLIIGSTGDFAAQCVLQHRVKEAVARYTGDPEFLFGYVKDFLTRHADGLIYPFDWVARHVTWPLSIPAKWCSQTIRELAVLLVGVCGREKRVRLCTWGDRQRGSLFECQEVPVSCYGMPSVMWIGKELCSADVKYLQSMLVSGLPTMEALTATIRSAAEKDREIGGEIFTRELSAGKTLSPKP